VAKPATAPTAAQQNSGIGSQMLRAANEFDQLVRGGSSRAEAILTMRYNRSRYDLKLLDALENAPVDNSGYDSRVVTVSQLDTLMIIDQEVRAKNGVLCWPKARQ
jgi:hypothetical protein